jgi:hypothetical protein
MHRRNALGGSNGPPLRRHLLRTPPTDCEVPVLVVVVVDGG